MMVLRVMDRVGKRLRGVSKGNGVDAQTELEMSGLQTEERNVCNNEARTTIEIGKGNELEC